jgi:diaminohydroxyphosphoribosylaminopyrimidine deaminase/5-amino-6-(5-phosphoribosylamino)uracil reductase
LDDSYYIKTALYLAEKGRGYTAPNPVVGAVVVKAGKVVGKGWHEAVGKAHAEVNAIDNAGVFAKNATLYVTLEPCNHTGRTPPCTQKILDAGIKRVVVAMEDPNPDVKGGGIDFLKKKGIDVLSGVCRKDAKKQNEVFIKYVKTRRPFVILKCASTLDGRIAAKTGDSKWITNPKSREFVHELRHGVDAIMVGIDTVKKDNPSLTTRLDHKKGKDPIRVILDTHLSIDENARVLQLDSKSDTVLVSGSPAKEAIKAKLESKGAKVVEIAKKNGLIDLDSLMDHLGKSGITSLLIEGGSRVIASSFSAGIVDKIYFFFGPKILGGDDGTPVCRGPGPDLMANCTSVKDISVRRFDDDIMIEGYIR